MLLLPRGRLEPHCQHACLGAGTLGARSFEEAYGTYLHDVRARWAAVFWSSWVGVMHGRLPCVGRTDASMLVCICITTLPAGALTGMIGTFVSFPPRAVAPHAARPPTSFDAN